LCLVFTALFALTFCLKREEELIPTPYGYMPRGCVFHAHENEIVYFRDGILRIESTDIVNGKVEKTTRLDRPAKCEYGKPRRLGGKRGTEVLPDGWAAYAYWLTARDFNYYGGLWTVPSDPVQEGLQTLFLFTGFQNAYFAAEEGTDLADVTSIIQPVLQWGDSEAGDEKYWAIASWFVAGETAVFSDLKGPLNNGDTIVGNMTLVSGTQWQIVTEDSSLKLSTTLTVDTDVSEIDAFVTLEVYGITDCSDYPNGSDTFSSLVLKVDDSVVTASWSPDTEVGCEESVTIVSPSEVTLNF